MRKNVIVSLGRIRENQIGTIKKNALVLSLWWKDVYTFILLKCDPIKDYASVV